jgi:hypothetical protein
MGAIAVIWGIVLFFMRGEILEFSREGGRGLRDRRVINALVITGTIFLIAGGLYVIVAKGL